MSNDELIESVRDWSTITRLSHANQLEKLVQLRDALIASEASSTRENGSCWVEAPRIRLPEGHCDPMPALCELRAGHLGAHLSGRTEWMTREPVIKASRV